MDYELYCCLRQASATTAQQWSQWRVQSIQLRRELGAEKEENPFLTLGYESVGLTMTARVSEILGLAALAVFKAHGIDYKDPDQLEHAKEALRHIYVDVSQNPTRRAWTNPATSVSKCLTTSTCLYSFGRGRRVLPGELMFLQGHSKEICIPESMTPSGLRDLAGEGMTLPCLGSLVLGLRLAFILD